MGGTLWRAVFLLFLLSGCTESPPPKPSSGSAGVPDFSIRLRWMPSSTADRWEEALAGLWWALSAVGAETEDENGLEVLSEGPEGVIFSLDLEEVGLPVPEAFVSALGPMRESAEYQRWGSVDAGRFLLRTIDEPWRYFSATQACPTVDRWRVRLLNDSREFAVTNSLLTDTDRLLRYNWPVYRVEDLAWLAEEGSGSLENGSFKAEGFEVVDIMPNGRERFAAYDGAGRIVLDPQPAGLPGRCQWCHENHVMGTVEQPDVGVGVGFSTFAADVKAQQTLIDDYRATLPTVVDFETYDTHEWAERIVELFLQPTASRIAAEWGTSEEDVRLRAKTAGFFWHENEEYPEFGEVLWREEVDALLLEQDPAADPLPTMPSARQPMPGWNYDAEAEYTGESCR